MGQFITGRWPLSSCLMLSFLQKSRNGHGHIHSFTTRGCVFVTNWSICSFLHVKKSRYHAFTKGCGVDVSCYHFNKVKKQL